MLLIQLHYTQKLPNLSIVGSLQTLVTGPHSLRGPPTLSPCYLQLYGSDKPTQTAEKRTETQLNEEMIKTHQFCQSLCATSPGEQAQHDFWDPHSCLLTVHGYSVVAGQGSLTKCTMIIYELLYKEILGLLTK